MSLLKRVSGLFAAAALCWLCVAMWADAQVTPTPEMLQIFQGLSPEQQQAIMDAVTGGSSGGGSGGGGLSSLLDSLGGTGTGDRSKEQQAVRADRRQQKQQAQQTRPPSSSEEEQADMASSQLRAQDWVIVDIDYQPRSAAPAALTNLPAVVTGTAHEATTQAAQAAVLAAAATQPPSLTTAPGSSAASAASNAGRGAQNELSDEDRARLDALMTLIRARNPYQLTREGALLLPGFPPIALLGLTEDQATLRLKVEPAFRGLEVKLTRLPLKSTGVEGLKPFGYDLFDNAPSTFAPVTDVPVPSDYVVGAGDELGVQLYGTRSRELKLTVERDGNVNFPELGPIHVAGETFSAAKANIEARVGRQMNGVRASVTMRDTRSIRVFVLGEARYPGSYTISGLGTITSALYAAGGVKRVGSLRNIELKRQGQVVRQLDLYDLLIRGDTTDDTKLLQGDVVFIPPVGTTVSVYGEVRRPAIYEVHAQSTVADVLQLAGGLTPDADTTKAVLTRIGTDERRVVLSVDLAPGARSELVRNGDVVRLMRLRPTLDSGILVQGHLYAPGTFAWRQGLRLTDVIHSVDDLRPDADIHYLLIRREDPADRHISVLSADLAAALTSPGSAADVQLMPRDRITVFDLASGRDRVIQPVLDELRLQGTSGRPSAVVHIDGQVRVPGEYPLEPGMKISDLIRAGGGTIDSAYGRAAELTRYSVVNGESRQTELIRVDLAAAVGGDASANLVLEPFDTLSVREVPMWDELESVTLKGEVRFPGNYSIRRGETLKSVLARAGGLTKFAFPEGSVFTRESLRRREQEQVDMLADRMQRDLTILALQYSAAGQGGGGVGALSVGQALLGQLRTTKAVGRLVIDLPRLTRSPVGSSADVILRDGDQLIVPRFQQQVTVIGEVQNATSHLFDPRLSRDDYISMSGGMTRRADSGRIYVVRANGSVFAQEGSRWFQSRSVAIKPGDTIVVPLNAEKIPPLPFWQAVTQILYNVAIAVAAVHSF